MTLETAQNSGIFQGKPPLVSQIREIVDCMVEPSGIEPLTSTLPV